MDIVDIALTIFDFLKLWIPLAIISLVLYKIFSPLRQKLADDYDFSWFKSTLLLNFVVIFIILLIAFLYFMFLGAAIAPLRDPAIEYNLLDDASFVAFGAIRIAVSAFILALVLLFFEMIASLAAEFSYSKSKHATSKKKARAPLLNQTIGILISTFIFLLLFLFIFDWVPLGLFVFVFYGKINELPLLIGMI